MNGKQSLYDLLEVSSSASAEAIQASFERLSQKFDSGTLAPLGGLDAQSRYNLIKDAFSTLSHPAMRTAYDVRLNPSAASPAAPELVYYPDEPRISWGVKIFICALVVASGLYAYKSHQDAAIETARLLAVTQEAERIKVEKQLEIEALALQRQEESQRARQAAQQQSEMERARREGEQISRRLENQEAQYQREDERKRQAEERQRQNSAREAQYRAERERQQTIRGAQQQDYRQDYSRPHGAAIEYKQETLSPSPKHTR